MTEAETPKPTMLQQAEIIKDVIARPEIREVVEMNKAVDRVTRFPRCNYQPLYEMLNNLPEPSIFLDETDDHVDIVVRFPGVSKDIKDMFGEATWPLSTAFDNILWSQPKREPQPEPELWSPPESYKSAWTDLSESATRAYRRAWARLAQIDSQRSADWASKEFLTIGYKTEVFKRLKTRLGRKRTPPAELRSTKIRFEHLLGECKVIHEKIRAIVKSRKTAPKKVGSTSDSIKKDIWETAKDDIRRLPDGLLILNGLAFKPISWERTHPAMLEKPRTWTARRLAISLLAHERNLSYVTMEEKVAEALRETPKVDATIQSPQSS